MCELDWTSFLSLGLKTILKFFVAQSLMVFDSYYSEPESCHSKCGPRTRIGSGPGSLREMKRLRPLPRLQGPQT